MLRSESLSLHFNRIARRFVTERCGNVAVIFAVACLPLLALIGVAIDASRFNSGALRISAALDSAGLAAARAQWNAGMTTAKLQKMAQDFFDANVIAAGAKVSCGSIGLNRDVATGLVSVSITCNQETMFGALVGVESAPITRDASVVYNLIDIDLALMLDITGSMSGSKISDLRDAATLLVDTLMGPSGHAGEVRIALAPYAASVNVGPYFKKITGEDRDIVVNPATGATITQPTCIAERTGSKAYKADAPKLTSATTLLPTLESEMSGATTADRVASANGRCPSAEILPLTNNAQLLRNRIKALPASGATAGHLGTAFARYLVAPEWGGKVWPAASTGLPYNANGTIKAVILMTDGIYNTDYSGSGSSASQALKHCDAIKADGVLVYSVAFKAPGSSKTLLEQCSSGPGYSFDTSTGSELADAYKKIAEQLMELRLAS